MDERIAIIIPAYNAERSLERAVRSVLDQTYSNIEIWIVDDGSTDGTASIADKLASYYVNIHVIHQKNSRCYRARLAALKKITAPYFGFVDSDDYVRPDMYEKLYSFSKENDLNIACCECCGFERSRNLEKEIFVGREEFVQKGLFKYSLFVWNKLYKNIYDFNAFEDVDLQESEDELLNLQAFALAGEQIRFGCLHVGLYHYERPTGTWRFGTKKLQDIHFISQRRSKLLAEFGIGADDPRVVQILLHQIRGCILVAAFEAGASISRSVENLGKVLMMDEVNEVLGCKQKKSLSLLFLAFLKKLYGRSYALDLILVMMIRTAWWINCRVK